MFGRFREYISNCGGRNNRSLKSSPSSSDLKTTTTATTTTNTRDSDQQWMNEVNWNTTNQIFFRTWPEISRSSIPADQIHELDISDKKILFQKSIRENQTHKETAKKLLQRLETLAPDVAANFELAPNLLDDFTMRIINNEKPNGYVAISYCWSPSYAMKKRERNDEDYHLPFDSLFLRAMQEELLDPQEGLWIDQLCINQFHPTEKNIAIPAMVAVYKNARKVIILLDDILISEQEIEFLKWFILEFEQHGEILPISRPFANQNPPFMQSNPHLRNIFEKICKANWFTRAWCSHEMRLGQRHIFYVRCEKTTTMQNQHSMVLCFTGEFLWYILTLSLEILNPDVGLQNIQRTIGINFDIYKQVERVRLMVGAPESAEDLENSRNITNMNMNMDLNGEVAVDYTLHIRDIFALGAGGDPILPTEELKKCDANCDKISIILNVAGNGLKLKRDHIPEHLQMWQDIEECYRHMLLVALAHGDPMPLCSLGTPLQLGKNSTSKYQSWLCHPDETDPGPSPKLPLSPLLSETATSKISISSDTINTSSSEPTSWISLPILILPNEYLIHLPQIYIQTARKITHLLLLFGFGKDIHSPTNIAPGFEYQIWRERVGLEMWDRAVACVLYCGIRWMKKVAFECGFPANERERKWRDEVDTWFNEGEGRGILDLMGEGRGSTVWFAYEEGLRGVNAILRFTNWMVSWGYGSGGDGNGKWEPDIWRFGEEGKVIIFSDVGDRENGNENFIGVPCCLLSDGYERLARGWILRRKNGDGNGVVDENAYVMRTKTRFYTDVSIQDEEESGWKLRENLKVYGPQFMDVDSGSGLSSAGNNLSHLRNTRTPWISRE